MTEQVVPEKPQGAIAAADRVLQHIENVLMVFGGGAIALAMVLVSADAFSRHVFSNPLTFQYTLTESFLMVMAFSLGLPWGYRTGGRIRILLLLTAVPAPVRLWVMRVGNVAAAIYLSVLAWQTFGKAETAFSRNDLIMGVIDWPVGWSWVWMPVGLGFLVLRLLVDACDDPDRGATGEH